MEVHAVKIMFNGAELTVYGSRKSEEHFVVEFILWENYDVTDLLANFIDFEEVGQRVLTELH